VRDKNPPLADISVARQHLMMENQNMCPQRLKCEGGWTLIRRPSLVVRGSDTNPEIISLYVTSECDPRIAQVLCDAEAVECGMMKYLKQVRFNPRKIVDRHRADKSQSAGRSHYSRGRIQMDGVFNFRFAAGVGYYTRDLAANKDH
jgi:hypothetical protein